MHEKDYYLFSSIDNIWDKVFLVMHYVDLEMVTRANTKSKDQK